MKRRVVVTGIGAISPLGFSKTELWNGLLNQKPSSRKESYSVNGKEMGDEFWAHRIENFDINSFNIDESELNYIKTWKKGTKSKILEYLLAAIKLALDDSSLDYNKDDNDIGCFVTVENPDFEVFCESLILDAAKAELRVADSKKTSLVKIIESVYKNNEGKGYDLHTFMYLYFVTKVFGLHGYSLFTNNACASGLFSLEEAARQIILGKSSIALAVGGEAGVNTYKYKWFKDRNIYADDGAIKSFSEDANGLVIGEGAAAIVLEEYNHAKKRKVPIYCEYLGGGFSLEGWKVIYPNVSKKYYYNAVKQALKAAGMLPNQVDVINPHGVGLKMTDLYEARVFSEIFCNVRKKPFVTAFKPYIGHNLGGSALIESIILMLLMQHNIILPLINCKHPLKELRSNFTKEPIKKTINVVMKMSCGFAGYNGAVIFKRV